MLLISVRSCLRALPLLAAFALLSAQSAPAQLAEASTPDTLPRTEATGDLLLARGRYVAAMELLRALEPKTAPIYNKMGVACEHMYMAAEARRDFEQAVRLNPRSSDAWNNLGTVFHTAGDLKHAERSYKKAIRLNPANATAELNLGTLYYGKAKYRKGDAAYRKALAVDPRALEHGAINSIGTQASAKSLAELHYHIAKTYAEAGNDPEALEALHKAVAEGFRDRKRLLADPEFANMRKTAEFGSVLTDLTGG